MCTLPETNSEFTPENPWLVQMKFFSGPGLCLSDVKIQGCDLMELSGKQFVGTVRGGFAWYKTMTHLILAIFNGT